VISDRDRHAPFPPHEFWQFLTRAIGAEYDPNLEEWRQMFALHLRAFVTCHDPLYGGDALPGNLQKCLQFSSFHFDVTPRFTGRGADAYLLPLKLLLLIAKPGYTIPGDSYDRHAIIADPKTDAATEAMERLLHGQEASMSSLVNVLADLKGLLQP
jgi:hypothetical protein